MSLQTEPRGEADQPECHHHHKAFERKAHHTTIVVEWCDDNVTAGPLTQLRIGPCAE